MKIAIGIPGEQREATAAGPARLLADTATHYLQSRIFHWNVSGPLFITLHGLTATPYAALAAAVGEIVERIDAPGIAAPGSWQQFADLDSLTEQTGVPVADDIIRQLVADQEAAARTAHRLLPLADEAGDQPTADRPTRQPDLHEKNAWMLRGLVA